MKREVEITISDQAKDFLSMMPEVSDQELLDWFVNVRRITIGGGDVHEYIRWKKRQSA